MQLKLLTIPYDPDSGGFPADPLADIEGEVLSVVEHFFHHAGMPQLLLIVHYRPHREARSASPRFGPDGVRAELAEPERIAYDRLRAWRNGRAQADGVPPYVILTNRQAAEIVRRQPRTLVELGEIQGIGEAKSRRYGRDLLATLTPPATEPPREAPRAGA